MIDAKTYAQRIRSISRTAEGDAMRTRMHRLMCVSTRKTDADRVTKLFWGDWFSRPNPQKAIAAYRNLCYDPIVPPRPNKKYAIRTFGRALPGYWGGEWRGAESPA